MKKPEKVTFTIDIYPGSEFQKEFAQDYITLSLASFRNFFLSKNKDNNLNFYIDKP